MIHTIDFPDDKGQMDFFLMRAAQRNGKFEVRMIKRKFSPGDEIHYAGVVGEGQITVNSFKAIVESVNDGIAYCKVIQ